MIRAIFDQILVILIFAAIVAVGVGVLMILGHLAVSFTQATILSGQWFLKGIGIVVYAMAFLAAVMGFLVLTDY